MQKILKYLLLLLPLALTAQQESDDFYVTKGKGFEFHFFDNQYQLNVDFRGQFRAATPFDGFPDEYGDFSTGESTIKINRARIKVGGHVFKPEYTFYFEQDIKGNNLLDFRVQIEKLPYLKLRVGQWKSRFTRERVISSGKQQGLDRSLLNSIFTIDRQQGISLYGNIAGEKAANFNYWASILMGTGRGGNADGDHNMMYMLRLQWNPNGKVLKFSGSDLEYHEQFLSSVAIAGVTNTSPYTSFSTKGGGQLPGFEPGTVGQYKVDQLLFETAFKFKGLSWQQEFHYKNVDDRVNLKETSLLGNYFQLGYFFHNLIPKIPKPLEVYARQSFYSPGKDIQNNYEYTFGMNWFFKGHKNKLTLEYSHLFYNEYEPVDGTGGFFRVQWDISIF
jgi:phosphate-selective porin